ncbi:acetyl-CoA-benzylalcohol acetyltransferase [Eucalyptus grandis]|uniref:acetyl-CoA-benzylalcohol acetyltransferase n=1 Tax=Eucalyptus grandis TaxID=71139 RepID=UPI00192E9E6F|nr:acetyl-CoA-benzylalcohol acetyltransferase [Eucalyptus grandis]
MSCIDVLQPPAHMGMLFYYRANGENLVEDTFQRLRLLEESLLETLAVFYPLAGRYVEEGHFIDCNDQGVEFVHTKVYGQLDQLLQGDWRSCDMDLHGRLSEFPLGLAGNSLVLIQANVLECGGLVISLHLTHKLGDACTMTTLMNSWATARTRGIHELASPHFELSSLFPVMGPVQTQWLPSPGGVKFTLNRFIFSGAALSGLKLAVAKHACIARVEGAFGNFYTMIVARHSMDQNNLSFKAFVEVIHEMFSSAKTRFGAIADREFVHGYGKGFCSKTSPGKGSQ